ncbi:tetratricopeptide repeat protein [Pukyongiella litopenaei]|uniref:Cell division coordinator CpoB n=1 Tax=Pukyongiella litopenaei TaxID=2605946 RepID=A0A2S0MM81_9RHOB|nr:tetratricopeptide repeat protein [Pukyongiella litopenaei]AVO36793.1 tetratricopeptide repeat protein [Pukyongiella litopenaei]
MKRLAALALAMTVMAAPLTAQSADTLADIRQELTVLHVEIQKLKRELSTTGGASAAVTGDSVLQRMASMEAELQRLTSQTEELSHRIDRIVADGTNRIGDLEFRLVELEGGDTSKLSETTTLGGGSAPAAQGTATPPPVTGGEAPGTAGSGEMAIGEEADFRAAETALQAGDYPQAVALYSRFGDSYPGSPFAARARLGLGRAYDGQGKTREAARAYLDAFTADASGTDAPEALFELGRALGKLGQVDQACITLGEISVRFPGAAVETNARSEMTALNCS